MFSFFTNSQILCRSPLLCNTLLSNPSNLLKNKSFKKKCCFRDYKNSRVFMIKTLCWIAKKNVQTAASLENPKSK